MRKSRQSEEHRGRTETGSTATTRRHMAEMDLVSILANAARRTQRLSGVVAEGQQRMWARSTNVLIVLSLFGASLGLAQAAEPDLAGYPARYMGVAAVCEAAKKSDRPKRCAGRASRTAS